MRQTSYVIRHPLTLHVWHLRRRLKTSTLWQSYCKAILITILLLSFLLSCGDQEADKDGLTTLDKLRTIDWDIWPDAGYDLALMGEESAIDVLLQAVKDESRDARWHAAGFLGNYDDPRILPGLETAFLTDPDDSVRLALARALAGIDADYAAEVFLSQFDEAGDPAGREIAVWLLGEMGDARVVPSLVKRLDDPAARRDAALELARFRDKRAVPALIEMLPDSPDYEYSKYSAGNIVDALVRIGDTSCISVLFGDESLRPVFLNALISHLRSKPVGVPFDFIKPIVAPLIEMTDRTLPGEIRGQAARVLGYMSYPQLAPTFGKIFVETDNHTLRNAMAQVLTDMGSAGVEYLLAGAKKKDRYGLALSRLANYNSREVLHAVAELALGASYPFRLGAIEALEAFGSIWPEEVLSFALELLRDPDPQVKLYTIRMIRRLEMRESEETLREAIHDTDERVRTAAIDVLSYFSGEIPLVLEIEMDRSSYRYNEPVNMNYKITNISPRPVTICTHGMDISGVIYGTAFSPPDIRKPDGTLLKYCGSAVTMAPPRKEHHRTLQPGDVLSGPVPISKFYQIYQPGRYTVKLGYRSYTDGIQFGAWWWPGVLRSQEISFKINRPSRRQLREMIAAVDIEKITDEESFEEAKRICHKLGELKSYSAVEALKKLAFYEPPLLEEPAIGQIENESSPEPSLEMPVPSEQEVARYRREELSELALRILAELPFHELVPVWLEMVDERRDEYGLAVDALVRLRHPRGIEMLRHQVFGSTSPVDSVGAALKLKGLGDNTGVEWLRTLALRKLKHWKPEERRDSVRILQGIRESEGIPIALADRDPEVRSWAKYWLKAVAEDIGVAGVEAMLDDPDPNVQRAAAYQLAFMGSAAGVYLIREDLNADDWETRENARWALRTLNQST